MKIIFLSCLSITMMTGCDDNRQEITESGAKNYTVYLFINNLSLIEGAVPTKVIIDDSVYMNKKLNKNSNQSTLYKKVFLNEGKHRIKTEFGPFKSDTTFSVKSSLSVFVDMRYSHLKQPLTLTPDGIRVTTLSRDGSPAID